METTYYFDVINDFLTCKIRYLDPAALRPKGFKLYAGCVKNIAFIRIDNWKPEMIITNTQLE